jgi:hypothetical protein
MTSRVSVSAHCAKEKQVQVSINDKLEKVLQDGESQDFYVYDDREIKVKEVLKPVPEAETQGNESVGELS